MRNRCRSWIGVLGAASLLLTMACSSPPVYHSRWRIPPIVRSTVKPCLDEPVSADGLELLHAGKEPRLRLRMQPQQDLRMTIPLDSETRLVAEQDGLTSTGTTCYGFTIETTMPDVFNRLPPDGGLSVSPDGRLRVRESRHPQIDWRTRPFHRGALMDRLFVMAPRLPTEAVGLGARWRLVRKRIMLYPFGTWHDDELTYTLVEMNGSSIGLQVHWHRDTPEQRVHIPNEDDERGFLSRASVDDETFVLHFDLQGHPLPKRSPVPLSETEIMRRKGYKVEKQQ